MDLSRLEVPLEKLRWRCDGSCFSFQCTDELVPLEEFIGQDRAIKAIDFGLSVDQPGYNIFVSGMTGTGKSSVIKAHLEALVERSKESGQEPRPLDWCYLHNLSDADRPNLVSLPPGGGKKLKHDMEVLVEELRSEVPKAFSGEDFDEERKRISEETQAATRDVFQGLDREARSEGFALQFSQMGVALIPLLNGQPASQEDFLALTPEVRGPIEEKRAQLMGTVQQRLEQVREIERSASQRLGQVIGDVAHRAVAAPFENIKSSYAENDVVLRFLDRLIEFAVHQIDVFREEDPAQPVAALQPQDAARAARVREALLPFIVNLFVDNSEATGPPIVVESDPSFGNLFGRIGRKLVLGGYVTDHTMLKPGSFQQADHGYLVLDVQKVVANPLVWETVKRVIKTGQVRPEDPAEVMGMGMPQGIKPDPMPLQIKVVVSGEPGLYNLLSAYDGEFWETFKVKADFDSQIRRSDRHLESYAAFICGACSRHGLLHLTNDAVGAVIEYAARLVADQEKLSTRFGQITDLLIEADFWARRDGDAKVRAPHVGKAIDERVYRSNLIAERMQEMMEEGTIMIDVDGAVVGQVNGLAVYSAGDHSFGKPSRITARAFLGRGGVVNIEREAQMSGKTHDKGVLIIGGYLGWKYAQEWPLSVSATIAFEQSYDGIDGDSASSTEIYAILSSLSDVPLKQSLAVTGSVNQKGEVQAIGGVNQKIEGFYDLCRALGLTGEQGVLIPKVNVRNLMLREDVVQAIGQGRFRIYGVSTIDEGIELLTGTPAGERGADGDYPEGTVNYLVRRRLASYAKSLKAASVPAGQAEDNAASTVSRDQDL